MNSWGMFSTQDSNSSIMEQLIFFHDYSLMIISMILIMIMYMLIFLSFTKFYNHNILENQLIEIIWTIFPMIILIFMAIPSLKILYLLDEISKPSITIKSTGHQWYWSYEYSNYKNFEFDSYMISFNKINNFRLLDVDNRMIIPNNLTIRILVNSADVIHSWTIPSMGIKIDANPGRLNQINLNFNRPGLFYGQCSEICGTNHSFMPIVVESTSLNYFLNWLKNF
uniref:Cytochrome c oxidase subunit 2 n=1 Tax=Aulacus sinensis TaxID=2491146 RepID=A0A3S8V0A0_9HYME|nr:cytochrome c oxidase subunit 2 [Aulacus sinensis]